MCEGKLLFVLGGARSGKSKFAEELAKKFNKNFNKEVIYIATFPANDDPEMIERIAMHKKTRPKNWKTLETGDVDDIISILAKNKVVNSVIIIECLTILVSNLLTNSMNDKQAVNKIIDKVDELIGFIKNENNSNNIYIVASNEVGQGIVPGNELARRYRDILGKANQLMAKDADEFYVMFAGVCVDVKGLNQN